MEVQVDKSTESEFEKLKRFLSRISEVPPLEWLYFISQLRIIRVKKGEFYFRQGEKTNRIGFVLSGLIHTFYVSDEGKERTKNFAWEGKLISPYASIIQQLPANFNAQALEATTVLTLSSDSLAKLYSRHKCWEKIGRVCAEKLLIEREVREFQMLMLSNLEKYEVFLKNYCEIQSRIPQYLVASYLGITPVALSRLLATPGPKPTTKLY